MPALRTHCCTRPAPDNAFDALPRPVRAIPAMLSQNNMARGFAAAIGCPSAQSCCQSAIRHVSTMPKRHGSQVRSPSPSPCVTTTTMPLQPTSTAGLAYALLFCDPHNQRMTNLTTDSPRAWQPTVDSLSYWIHRQIMTIPNKTLLDLRSGSYALLQAARDCLHSRCSHRPGCECLHLTRTRRY